MRQHLTNLRPDLFLFHRRRCRAIPPRRTFSSTTIPTLLIALHDVTHTPWALTLPLLGLSVSLLFRAPFTLLTHRQLRRRARLAPLLQALTARLAFAHRRLPAAIARKESERRFGEESARIFRKLGLQGWKSYLGFLGVPAWLGAIDGVRRLAGGGAGLLGSLFFSSSSSGSAGGDGGGVGDLVVTLPELLASAADRAVQDPRLAVEGALWFPDLTVADPWHVLPLALSGVLVAGMVAGSSAGQMRRVLGLESDTGQGGNGKEGTGKEGGQVVVVVEEAVAAKGRLRLQRAALLVAACVGPVTMDMPAALHLYWLGSSAAHLAVGWGVKRVWPLKGAGMVERCRGGEAPVIRPGRS